MDAQKRDRRGDRRSEEWRCLNCRPSAGTVARTPVELEDGRVVCSFCRTIDRRSTEGNRRRAEAELGQLCRRIERELHGRLEELEGSVAYAAELREQLSTELRGAQSSLHRLDDRVRDVEYTADDAKRAAEDAKREAERAGRGW